MRSISIKMGLWMLVGFITFFLLMFMMGLGHRIELRVFNGIIHISCLYLAIKSYRELHPETVGDPISGVAQGVMASLIGILGFTVFMTIFLSVDTNLMAEIRKGSPVAIYLEPFTVSLFILAEGIVISVIGSYILTRILDMKISRVEH